MSLKKTDLVKNLAKKLDGRMKAAGVPRRFAQGAADVADKKTGGKHDAHIAKGSSAAKNALDKLDGKNDDIPDDKPEPSTPSKPTQPKPRP